MTDDIAARVRALWEDGLLPSSQAPVWPMAAFRDRFLGAFGSTPSSD